MSMTGIVRIGLLVLLILIALRLLPQILPVVRQRLQVAIPRLEQWIRGAFCIARDFLTASNHLSPFEALSQVVGSVFGLVAAVTFILCELVLTLARLLPLIGLEFDFHGGIFEQFDYLMGFSVIGLSLIFGFSLSDLVGWTSLTRLAVIKRARVAAFCVSAICFLASLVVGLALMVYALPVLLSTEDILEDAILSLQRTPAIVILLSLAVLLIIGTAMGLLSLEAFVMALTALLVVLGGVLLALIWIGLGIIDFLIELVMAGTMALSGTSGPFMQALQRGFGCVIESLGSLKRIIIQKLRRLVNTPEDFDDSKKAYRSVKRSAERPSAVQQDQISQFHPDGMEHKTSQTTNDS